MSVELPHGSTCNSDHGARGPPAVWSGSLPGLAHSSAPPPPQRQPSPAAVPHTPLAASPLVQPPPPSPPLLGPWTAHLTPPAPVHDAHDVLRALSLVRYPLMNLQVRGLCGMLWLPLPCSLSMQPLPCAPSRHLHPHSGAMLVLLEAVACRFDAGEACIALQQWLSVAMLAPQSIAQLAATEGGSFQQSFTA